MNTKRQILSTMLLVLFVSWHFTVGVHFHSHSCGPTSADQVKACSCGSVHLTNGSDRDFSSQKTGSLEKQFLPGQIQSDHDCLFCKLHLLTAAYLQRSPNPFQADLSTWTAIRQASHSLQKATHLYRARGPPVIS